MRLQILKTHLNVVTMWLLWAGMETAAETPIANAWTKNRREKRAVILLPKHSLSL